MENPFLVSSVSSVSSVFSSFRAATSHYIHDFEANSTRSVLWWWSLRYGMLTGNHGKPPTQLAAA
jgi:hypothetical protein